MKKMSKMKKFVIAAMCAITGFGTAASIGGTYAWFVAANTVSVTGLTMEAQAEEGIVIAQEKATALAAADWKTEVGALHTGAGQSFIPTTTKALSISGGWEHANVDLADDATHGAEYEAFTIVPATVGTAASVATGTTSTQVLAPGKNVYLYNEFYIQAAAKAAMTTQNLYVKQVTATDNGDPDQALNKSLRIGFKIGTEVKVYCPLLGTAFAGTTHAYAAAVASLSGSEPNAADYIYTNQTIPAYADAGPGIKLEVYCWFDGEDANCKSSNIQADFSDISISFQIANVKTSA